MTIQNLKPLKKTMITKNEPEKSISVVSGFLMLIPFGLAILFWLYLAGTQIEVKTPSASVFVLLFILGLGVFFALFGFFILTPNEAIACTFFGKYSGAYKQEGFWYANPFYKKQTISLKMLNYASGRIKVNEATGSPIEVECVVSWCVDDVQCALFNVQNFQKYLETQVEAALRQIIAEHPYEPQEGKLSLRSGQDEISKLIEQTLQNQCNVAGLKVMSARISHLAYAPEIAQMMLKRQQALAVVSARQTLVEGAMGMVKDIVTKMQTDIQVPLNQEQQAQLVINTLTVLLSDSGATPVLTLSSAKSSGDKESRQHS